MLKQKASMKIKKRYLLLSCESKEVIEKVILDYIGILGYAKAACFFVDGERKDGKIILSVERKSIDDVRAAFELSTQNIKVLGVSGTIKGLEKK